MFPRLPLFRLKSKTGRSVVGILETHEESRLLVTRLRSNIWISVKFISFFFSFFFFFNLDKKNSSALRHRSKRRG